jgi:MFS family permease
MYRLSTVQLIAALCVCQAFSQVATATYPALLPVFMAQWALSNTEAGWISGVFYVGYVATVPVLVSLTDRRDARMIVLLSMALSAVAALGFAFLAEGLWSASAWRALQGIGMAGTYMPGLKALTDRIPDASHGRAVAFYTSSFGIGTSLSFFTAGEVNARLGWDWAFGLSALAPALGGLVAAAVLAPQPIAAADHPTTALLDFRPVFANREAFAYTLAYMVHNAELFALRSWIVAYLVFSQSQQAADTFGLAWRATAIATVVNLCGMPASVLGNELARRFGRPLVLLVVMTVSAATAVALGFVATLSYGIVLGVLFFYAFVISADSSTITGGAVTAADPRYRGATMAVHSMVGFLGAIAGPIVFGGVLDLSGGETAALAWGLGFSTAGAIVLLGPLFVYTLGRSAKK